MGGKMTRARAFSRKTVPTETLTSSWGASVTLAIAKRAGSNAVVVAEAILSRVDQLHGNLIPSDISVDVTRNYGETANEKANELLYHLGLATVSIIALVWLAIGRREALVVAVVIPITILLTLFASRLMGYTLNRVSLFAQHLGAQGPISVQRIRKAVSS